MGTNWYTLKGEHIGKTSAAGWYCYKCKLSLCRYGEEMPPLPPAFSTVTERDQEFKDAYIVVRKKQK